LLQVAPRDQAAAALHLDNQAIGHRAFIETRCAAFAIWRSVHANRAAQDPPGW
jgi:hypothetical protein